MNNTTCGIIMILILGMCCHHICSTIYENHNNLKNDYIISTEDCIILECRRAVMFNPDRLLIECNKTKSIIQVPNMLDYYVGQHLTKTIWSYKPIEYK